MIYELFPLNPELIYQQYQRSKLVKLLRMRRDAIVNEFTFTGKLPIDPKFQQAMQQVVNAAVEMHRKEQAELNERLRVAFTIANGGIEPSAEEVMLRAQRLIHPDGKEAYTWDGEEVLIVNDTKEQNERDNELRRDNYLMANEEEFRDRDEEY